VKERTGMEQRTREGRDSAGKRNRKEKQVEKEKLLRVQAQGHCGWGELMQDEWHSSTKICCHVARMWAHSPGLILYLYIWSTLYSIYLNNVKYILCISHTPQ